MNHLIEIVKIFNNNELDIYLRNKLINSLVDKKLYNNNTKLINKLNFDLKQNCFLIKKESPTNNKLEKINNINDINKPIELIWKLYRY